jgi:hypothetical protein
LVALDQRSEERRHASSRQGAPARDDVLGRSASLVRSLFRLGLVDRVRVMVFPTIRGETGEGPVFADLPDLDLSLSGTRVIDERLVLLDYRVASTR